MIKKWLINQCVCGKKFSFNSEKEAYAYLSSSQAPHELTYSYKCTSATNTWHVTSKKPNTSEKAIAALESELHREMAVVSDAIVSYMRTKYQQGRQTKFTAKEIKTELAKTHPYLSNMVIQNAITRLKLSDVLVTLDGKVPGTANGSYYTLSEILDKETEPKKKETTDSMAKTVTIPIHKPKQTESKPNIPKPPVANPFDKVFTDLGEIKAKLNGLAQGYSEIVNKPLIQGQMMDTSSITAALEEIKTALATAPVAKSNTPPFNYKQFVDELTRRLTLSDSNLVGAIANEVNSRLADLRQSDSFIYSVRAVAIDGSDRLLEHMAIRFDEQHTAQNKLTDLVNSIKAPEQITNPDDYKQGIREGIRMAVELGITRIN